MHSGINLECNSVLNYVKEQGFREQMMRRKERRAGKGQDGTVSEASRRWGLSLYALPTVPLDWDGSSDGLSGSDDDSVAVMMRGYIDPLAQFLRSQQYTAFLTVRER